MRSLKKINAFTLLEMMLVTLVIGVLASMGIAFFQKYSVSSKINKTANQMQQILQAAAAYYVDNGCWPGSAQNANCKQCTVTPPDFNQYLKLGTGSNPFGAMNTYTYQPEPQSCKKFQVYSGALPSAEIRDRVLASLASGVATSGADNQVMSEIITPAKQTVVLPNYIIQSISTSEDDLEDGSTGSFSFTCPAGWQGYGFATPIYIHPDDWIKNPEACVVKYAKYAYGPGSNAISLLTAPVICTEQTSIKCNYQVIFKANRLKANGPLCGWKSVNAGDVQFLQVGYCYNPNI